MAHKHNWQREQRGMKENPGCWSQGERIITREECSCGATRRTESSIVPTHTGRLTETTVGGRTTRRDSRNWR